MSSSQRVRKHRERQRALGRRERWISDQEMQIVLEFRKYQSRISLDTHLDELFLEMQLELEYENA